MSYSDPKEAAIYSLDGSMRLFQMPNGNADGLVFSPAGVSEFERRGNVLHRLPSMKETYVIGEDGLVFGYGDRTLPIFTTIEADDFWEHWER